MLTLVVPSELKRREKQRAKEASKAAKAPPAQPEKEKKAKVNEEELNPNVCFHSSLVDLPLTGYVFKQYYEMRSRQIQELKKTQNPNPYPHKYHATKSIPSYIREYGPEGKIQKGEKLAGTVESLTGRIHNIRASGSKLIFYDLHAEGTKVQIMATLQCVSLLFAVDSTIMFLMSTLETRRIRIHSLRHMRSSSVGMS